MNGGNNMLGVNFSQIRLWDLVDILMVAFVLYKLIILIRQTKAVQLIKGLVILFLASTLTNFLGLHTMDWLLRSSMTVIMVALPIVFQPELRRALEQLGRGKFLGKMIPFKVKAEYERFLNEFCVAMEQLANKKIGVLVVIERETGLDEYIETGIEIDGRISKELIGNIFIPNTPLHDGAVIIRGQKIVAAGCYLPLTESFLVSKELGTRHRAGIGVTEQTDGVAVIVSEETGIISLGVNGRLKRNLDKNTLRKTLGILLNPQLEKSLTSIERMDDVQ